MGNISIKLNLQQLKHVRKTMKGVSGDVEVLIIPIAENKLFAGEKGVYLDATAIEIKDRSKFGPDQKDTHLIKQSFPKEVYDAMSQEQREAMPIIGNAVLWGRRESEPQASQFEPAANEEEHDDLPF